MTLPWCPLPRALLTSPRARMLSLEAVGALFVAWSLSDDAGEITPPLDCDAREALVFVVAQHARESADGDESRTHAVGAVAELVDGGLLIVEGDALRLAGWVRLDGAPQPRPSAPPPPADDAPTDGPRRPGRPRKGAAPIDGTERKRRTRFEAREGSFRDVPEGVTYEEWTAAKLADDRRETPPRNSPPPRNSAAKLRRETPVEGRASDPEDQKDAENKGEGASGAREHGRETPPRNSAADAAKLPDDRRETPPRCGTVEEPGALDTLDVLDRMRRASGDRLATNLHTAPVAAAFGAIARDLIAREVTTVDGLVKAAAHAQHDRWVSQQGKLPLARLLKDDGRILLDLIAGSTTCADCGGDPLVSGVIALDDDSNGDPAWLIAAQAKYRRENPLPTGTEGAR